MTNETLNFNVGDEVYLLHKSYSAFIEQAHAIETKVNKVYKNGVFTVEGRENMYFNQTGAADTRHADEWPYVTKKAPALVKQIEAAKQEKMAMTKVSLYIRKIRNADPVKMLKRLEEQLPEFKQ